MDEIVNILWSNLQNILQRLSYWIKSDNFLSKTNKVSIDETLFWIDYYRILCPNLWYIMPTLPTYDSLLSTLVCVRVLCWETIFSPPSNNAHWAKFFSMFLSVTLMIFFKQWNIFLREAADFSQQVGKESQDNFFEPCYKLKSIYKIENWI